ncbi:MAG: PASTA domain-containing protein [Stomatobaculum sp.]|nr:PASTA domain-containing protein [Stomatobaculum sp.]MBR7058566.1 PASTA domain-containing protein [Stomatobaculum sp.]
MLIRCLGCMQRYEDNQNKCPHCGYVRGTAPEEAYHIRPGTILSKRYLIGRVLGFGGFGVTYIGYDMTLDKVVAVKEYLPGEFATRMPHQTRLTVYPGEKQEQFSAGKEKFLDESRKMVRFQHVPEVVHVFDCFEENGTAYIVMEYLEGESLKQKLERDGRMTVEEALPIILDVLHALEAVHAEGILHRDVAPDNICLTKDGRVKLLDFGAARFATTTHSRSLTVLIKPGYAPEEQYRSRGDQGTWTDVYATAATFYRMITGITPDDALERAARDMLRPPSKCGVKIGPNTENAIMNALNVKVQGRTQTAKDFENDLMANVVKRVNVRADTADTGKWPLWSKILLGTAAAGVLVFGILSATVLRPDSEDDMGAVAVEEGYTRVPNVVNQEREEAIHIAEDAGLLLQIYDKQYSNEIQRDRILKQEPGDAETVEKDSALRVVISAGIERTIVPSVIGMTREAAEKLMKDADLIPEMKEVEYAAAPGTVISQSLDGDSSTDTGTEVLLEISTGLPGGDAAVMETVQDLTGQAFEEASREQAKHYLYLVNTGTEYSDEFAAGQIIRQDAAAGSQLPQNSAIQVVVSLGRELLPVPDVVNKRRAEAEELLRNAGFVPVVREEYARNVEKGSVTRFAEEITEDTRKEKGSEIVIFVSMGQEPKQPVQSGGGSGSGGGRQSEQPAAAPAQTAAPPTQAPAPPPTEAPAPPPTQAPAPAPAPAGGGDDLTSLILQQ